MSYSKIRHIQNVNLILERRHILKESKATDILNAYPKGSVIDIKEFVKGFKDDVIGVVLSNMVDVFDKVKISGRRPSEGAAFYNFERKEIDINKNSPYWNEVDSDSIGAGLAHEFVHYLKGKYGSDQAVLDITNPNNSDKSIRNQEIEAFSTIKEQEILGNLTKPNFENQYQHEALSLKKQQSSINNPYKFSDDTNSINNSSLRYSSADKFDKTQQIINEQKIDNAVVGRVKKEQDEGL